MSQINFYEMHPCPKCKGNGRVRFVGNWKNAYVIECKECGFIAANYDEARPTLVGAIRSWNKKCELNKESDSN